MLNISKWIKGLNVRWETIKLLEENTGILVFDINHSNVFSDLSPKTKEIKEKLNIWGLIKLKTSAQQRKSKTKWKTSEWEKIFANDLTDKGLVSNI